MATTYRHRGDRFVATAGTGGVSSGDVVTLTNGIGIVIDDAASGESYAMMVDGVHELAALSGTGNNWSQGDRLYWDVGESELTNSAGTGDVHAGIAAADKAAGDTTALVLLTFDAAS